MFQKEWHLFSLLLPLFHSGDKMLAKLLGFHIKKKKERVVYK